MPTRPARGQPELAPDRRFAGADAALQLVVRVWGLSRTYARRHAWMLHVYFPGERLGGLAQPRCRGPPGPPSEKDWASPPFGRTGRARAWRWRPVGWDVSVHTGRKAGWARCSGSCPRLSRSTARTTRWPWPGCRLCRLLWIFRCILVSSSAGSFRPFYVVTWLQTMWSTAASSRSIGPILRRSSPEPEPASRR